MLSNSEIEELLIDVGSIKVNTDAHDWYDDVDVPSLRNQQRLLVFTNGEQTSAAVA